MNNDTFKSYVGIFQSSRSYENTFFRKLNAMFDRIELEGAVYSHPECKNYPYLKPDCILFTKHAIIIIDFKDYGGGEVILPGKNDDFRSTDWIYVEDSGERKVIKGGSGNKNPFCQLDLHREGISELLFGVPGINNRHPKIMTCVLFHGNDGPVKITNSVPASLEHSFFVATQEDCLKLIFEHINIQSNDIDLDSNSYHSIRQRFIVSNFEDYDKEFNQVDSHEIDMMISENEKLLSKLSSLSAENSNLKKSVSEAVNRARKAEEEAQRTKVESEKEINRVKSEAKEEIKDVTRRVNQRIAKKEENLDNKTKIFEAGVKANVKTAKDIKKALWRVVASLGIIALIFIVGLVYTKYEENQAIINQKNSGEICLTVDEVQNYQNVDGVCVEYNVMYANENDFFIYLNNTSNGVFNVVIQKNSVKNYSLKQAKTDYLGKRIRVKGKIVPYQDRFEIKVYSLNQIVIVD